MLHTVFRFFTQSEWFSSMSIHSKIEWHRQLSSTCLISKRSQRYKSYLFLLRTVLMAGDDTKIFYYCISLSITTYIFTSGLTCLLIGGLYYARDNPLVQNYRNTSCHIISTESRTYKCGRNKRSQCYEIEWRVQRGVENSIWSVIIDKTSISSQVSKRFQAFPVRDQYLWHKFWLIFVNE